MLGDSYHEFTILHRKNMKFVVSYDSCSDLTLLPIQNFCCFYYLMEHLIFVLKGDIQVGIVVL